MKNILYILAGVLSLLVYSCQKDNFHGPDAQIFGAVYDSLYIGKPNPKAIPQEPNVANNGSLIKYIELGFLNPNPNIQSMVFKLDGTYRNNLMFSANYDIFMVSGNNFYRLDTLKNYQITSGLNELNFYATPYLRVSNESIKLNANGQVVATFTISEGRPGAGIKASKLALFAHLDPTVCSAITYNSTSPANVQTGPATLPFTATITVNATGAGSLGLIKGKEYNFRVGALSNASASKYNYGESIVKLTIP